MKKHLVFAVIVAMLLGSLPAARAQWVVGIETREKRQACNGQCADQERRPSDLHFLVKTAHVRHFVRVHGVNDAPRSEEQTSLEHGVRHEVEDARPDRSGSDAEEHVA